MFTVITQNLEYLPLKKKKCTLNNDSGRRRHITIPSCQLLLRLANILSLHMKTNSFCYIQNSYINHIFEGILTVVESVYCTAVLRNTKTQKWTSAVLLLSGCDVERNWPLGLTSGIIYCMNFKLKVKIMINLIGAENEINNW